MRDLQDYVAKRNFAQTPEPRDGAAASGTAPRFSLQKHTAVRLHRDLRLAHDGMLRSEAGTRGPSLNPKDKRLAVRAEDHLLECLAFEGTILQDISGGGNVMLWDVGWWQPFHDVNEGLASGHIHVALLGQRSTGKWSLIRMQGRRAGESGRENWLLIKPQDAAVRPLDKTARHDSSVATGRDLPQIAANAPTRPLSADRRAKAPKFTPPQLADLQTAPPEGEMWWHEVKQDGCCTQIVLGKGGARMFTRKGLDWTDRFAPLLPALNALPADSAAIDGEILAGAGLERFGDVPCAIEQGGPFVFYGFDLLSLDGTDLFAGPLTDRRAALESLFAEVVPRGVLRLSSIRTGTGAQLCVQVGEAGGEGLVSKLRDAPYRSGRSAAWAKPKADRRGPFVITAFQHSTARGKAFASLLLVARQDGELVYRGKVGTGFDAATEANLAARFTPLSRKTPTFSGFPDLRAKITWLDPRLIAEVHYA